MFYFETFQIILNPSSVLKAFVVLMKFLSLSQFYAPNICFLFLEIF